MKIDTRSADRFARTPTKSCVLVYGPDQGLVRERARTLVESVLGKDVGNPFRMTELSGAQVGGTAGTLMDEAAALSLIGGRRVVRVVAATDGQAEPFAALLHARAGRPPEGESLVVVEAGELGPRSALRRLFEESPDGASVACYADEGEGLLSFAESALGVLGHRVDGAALDWMARALGGDRSIIRRELEKLSTYVGPGNSVTVADVEACLGDSADIDIDDAAVAAATGDLGALDRAVARSFAAGQSPITLLRAIGRELLRLHQAAGAVAAGASVDGALAQMRPPVFFKVRSAYERALRAWRVDDLTRAIEMVADAEVQCKRGAPDEAVVWRAALRIANAGRRPAA